MAKITPPCGYVRSSQTADHVSHRWPNPLFADSAARSCQQHEHLKYLYVQTSRTCFAWCKVVRPGRLVRSKIRLIESGTDLTTILRYIFPANIFFPDKKRPFESCTHFAILCR